MYATGGGWGSSKMRTAAYRGRGENVTPRVYVRTQTISFHTFGSVFVLQCLVLFVEIQPYLYSRKMCSSETVTVFQRDQFLSFFLLKITGVETLKQVAVVSTAFLFCYGGCVCGLFLILRSKVVAHFLNKLAFLTDNCLAQDAF